MSAKPKRPTVLDLGSLLVTKPAEPAAEEVRETPPPAKSARAAKPAKVAPTSFRTSVFFSRAVHDKLRTIAFEERKTVTDLINEGLDAVLQARNYPSTKELRDETE
jgi:antitoxin-like ribbon-helix-helix protein